MSRFRRGTANTDWSSAAMRALIAGLMLTVFPVLAQEGARSTGKAVQWSAPASNPVYAALPAYAFRFLEPSEIRVARRTGRISILLPDGRNMRFLVTAKSVNAGVSSLRGVTDSAELLLTTDGTRAFGYILEGGKKYTIDTATDRPIIADGDRMAGESTLFGHGPDDFIVDEQAAAMLDRLKAAGGEHALGAEDGPAGIDVAIFYDPAVAEQEGQQLPRTRAQAAIDFTNAAIERHAVAVHLRLVYVGPLSAPLSGDPFNWFVADAAKWDTARSYGADLLHYMYYYTGNGYCGKAYLPGRVGVSALRCNVFEETVAHELGHNIGMAHDRANAGYIPANAYNFGYVCGGRGTLMAYYWPRVPHYSSPLLQNGGQSCGVEPGQPGAAFNGKVLADNGAATAAHATEQPAYGTISIVNSGALTVDEAQGTVAIQLRRDGDLSQPVSVEIGAIDDGTAVGRDYVDVVERLYFESGQSSKTVHVSIVDDEEYEPVPESVEIVLRYPQHAIADSSTLRITIVSEDPDRGRAGFEWWASAYDENAGTIRIPVVRSGSTAHPLRVFYETRDLDARAGVDYQAVSGGTVEFAIGQTVAHATVTLIDNAIYDGYGYKQFLLRLSGDNLGSENREHTVWVYNDDLYRGKVELAANVFYVVESAGVAEVTVQRTGGSEGRLSFSLSYPGTGTAVPGSDYYPGSIGTSLNDGEISRSLGVRVVDNANIDGQRYLDIALTGESGLVGANATGRIVIIDDDGPTVGGGELVMGTARIEVDEPSGIVAIPVRRRGGAQGAAVVQYSTVGGTAGSGGDFVAAAGSIVWADGDASDKFIRVQVLDDQAVEDDETFVVRLVGSAGATLGAASETTVLIISDEGPDSDGDGVIDRADNCRDVVNPDQKDLDRDNLGDACDPDDDNDGINDSQDRYPNGFADVPAAHWAFPFVEQLALSGVTTGCGNANYCPGAAVTRAQMAVFLVRGAYGAAFVPVAATGTVFSDVPAGAFAASFIEELQRSGITTGCGSGRYCPSAAVTRDQMAVFLLRAKYGSTYSPPASTGLFADVSSNHWAVRWIEQLAREGITVGCGGGHYCPGATVTRDQMAVFLVRTFGL